MPPGVSKRWLWFCLMGSPWVLEAGSDGTWLPQHEAVQFTPAGGWVSSRQASLTPGSRWEEGPK